MDFLDPHGARMRDVQMKIAGADHLAHRAAVAAGERDHRDAARLRDLHRLEHVLRIPRGRYGEEDIALVAERFDLAREHAAEIVVVGDRGERAGVGGERDRGQAGALALEAAHHLRGEMLAVGGRAAVAAGEHLAPALQRLRERFPGARDLRRERLRHALAQLDAFQEMLLEVVYVVHLFFR